MSASGFERCTRYFDDLKIILVDRDPRDIFLSMKYIWKERDEFWDNVQLFCDWYRWVHQMSFPRPTNVLGIRFEDLIYHYAREVDKIEQFIGGGLINPIIQCQKPHLNRRNQNKTVGCGSDIPMRV